mgnify:CR=1 FL=1
MNSPFQYGTIAQDENFIDRDRERALLKQLLSSGINVMLISPRRWGKSSLVKKAMDELTIEQKNIKVCYIDAFAINSEAEFYRTFASRVMSSAYTRLDKGLSSAKKLLTGIMPQLVFKDSVTEFLTIDVRFKPQEKDKIEILRLPEKIAEQRGIKIIVCIDEFQRFASFPEYGDMEGKMRSVWQSQQRVSYCLYGSKRHMMNEIFNNSSKPFYRFGQVLYLDKIAKDDWMQFIINGFTKTGKRINEHWASRVCDITRCHSWYLQQFCFFLWNNTSIEVDETTFDRSLKQLIDTNMPMFVNDIEHFSASQLEMLRAVHSGETQLSGQKAREFYGLGNPNTITKNKKTLINRDIIELNKGEFNFVDPIFELWFDRDYCQKF